jgi:site-specific DNA-cytosine methylase
MVLWRPRVVAPSPSHRASGNADDRNNGGAGQGARKRHLSTPRRTVGEKGAKRPRVALAAADVTPSQVTRRAAPAASRGRHFHVHQALRSHMAAWGPRMRKEVEEVASRRGLQLPPRPLLVGTDCSGLDAPVFALRALQLPRGFQHVFCCDVDAKKRKFLQANSPSAQVYNDMLRRDHSQLPEHDLYVVGFPCKPFSRLHVGTQGFKERAARPFQAVLKTLREKKPLIAVLENVSGLRTYLERIHRELYKLGWYEVLTIEVDPWDMGEPVRRRRFYFLLVRTDVAVAKGTVLDDHVRALLSVGMSRTRATPAERLLRNDSPHVTAHQRRATARVFARRPKHIAAQDQQKWRKAHRGHSISRLHTPVIGLSQRSEEVLGIKLAEAGLSDLSSQTNIDVSQSLSFSRFTEFIPTITPGSQIIVGQLRRLVVPIEKCVLNAVPVHEAIWPTEEEFSDTDIADLGGNTMHLMAVAKAMLCAAVLVDWSSQRLSDRTAPGSRPAVWPTRPREIRTAK